MSSGWNGIPIPTVGKTRRRLAELLCQLTGWLVEAEDLQRTNPINQHFEDCCAWDCWATVPGSPPHKAHIYSWDRMRDCVKWGVVKVDNHRDGPFDLEVCAAESK